MDCSHYECVMNKQRVIEKLYFMLGGLVNEGLCASVCVSVCVCVARAEEGRRMLLFCACVFWSARVCEALMLGFHESRRCRVTLFAPV